MCPQGHLRKRLAASLRTRLVVANKANSWVGQRGTGSRGTKYAKQSQSWGREPWGLRIVDCGLRIEGRKSALAGYVRTSAGGCAKQSQFARDRPETVGGRREAGGSGMGGFAKQSQFVQAGVNRSPAQERGYAWLSNYAKQSQFMGRVRNAEYGVRNGVGLPPYARSDAKRRQVRLAKQSQSARAKREAGANHTGSRAKQSQFALPSGWWAQPTLQEGVCETKPIGTGRSC